MDPRLKTPFTCMVAGGSGCGKSTLITAIITRLDSALDRVPQKIVIAYSRMQPLYEEMSQAAPCPVVFVEGLDQDFKTEPNTLLIVDDLQGTDNVRTICQWFTKNSHHYDTSVFYLVQNIFDKTPEHRTISLNAHYIIAFKNPRDASQISHLSKQVYPHAPKVLVDAYKKATHKAHGYLVLDFRQDTDDLYRLRDGVFIDNVHVYVDESTTGDSLTAMQNEAVQRPQRRPAGLGQGQAGGCEENHTPG